MHSERTESLLRRMLETIPDLIWLKDAEGVYLGCNPAFSRFFGAPEAEIVGKTDYDFVDSELADSFREHDRLAMEAGVPSTNEEWITFADDGHRALVETVKTPMRDDAGRLTGVLGIAREVTELRAAQEELRRRDTLLMGLSYATDHILSGGTLSDESIADALKSLGALAAVDRVYVFEHTPGYRGSRGCMSQRYEWALDGVKAQINNPDLQNVSWDDMAPRWYDEFLAGRHIEGHVADFPASERAVLEPQGIVSVLALPIDLNGELWGFIGFDVCSHRREWSSSEVALLRSVANVFGVAIARKRAEAARRESEENFRTFFDTMSDMIVVGSPDGRIVYSNPAVSKKLGYSPDELKTMLVLDLNPDDRRAEAEEILNAMFKGERDVCPLSLQTKEGVLVPAETRIWFGRWNGADCIFGVSKDLSGEQEALQRFDRLFRCNPAPMALNGTSDGRFTDVNDAFLKVLGYTRDEVIGRTSAEIGFFVEDDKQQEVAEHLRAHARITDRELKVRRKDGSTLDGLFSGEIIRSQGEDSFLTVMVDVTELKRAADGQGGS